MLMTLNYSSQSCHLTLEESISACLTNILEWMSKQREGSSHHQPIAINNTQTFHQTFISKNSQLLFSNTRMISPSSPWRWPRCSSKHLDACNSLLAGAFVSTIRCLQLMQFKVLVLELPTYKPWSNPTPCSTQMSLISVQPPLGSDSTVME